MSTEGQVRPELIDLTEDQRQRVLTSVHQQCAGCGRTRFTVGRALPLGFLFVTADPDTYRVALTCTRRGCPAPRTSVVLPADAFLA